MDMDVVRTTEERIDALERLVRSQGQTIAALAEAVGGLSDTMRLMAERIRRKETTC